MRVSPKLVLIFLFILFIYILIYINSHNAKNEIRENFALKVVENVVTIAVVACGRNRVDEALVMIKSALIFAEAKTTLDFVIITEEELKENLVEKLKILGEFKKFTHKIVNLKFPDDNKKIWENLFKPCASQRLFLPSLLPHIDSLIYVDCDVLFLSPPEDIFSHFKSFDELQISALAPESENRNTGWYTRFARHPYFEPFGVNSGVMLMNLTRMRTAQFEEKIPPIYEKFKNQLSWGDQDLINIYFHQHPDEVHLMKCEYNYRPDHCMYVSQCNINDGVKLLHGNRAYFHKNGKQSAFREIYKAIDEFNFITNPCENIVEVVEKRIEYTDSANCNELLNEFLQIPKKLFCNNKKNNEIKLE